MNKTINSKQVFLAILTLTTLNINSPTFCMLKQAFSVATKGSSLNKHFSKLQANTKFFNSNFAKKNFYTRMLSINKNNRFFEALKNDYYREIMNLAKEVDLNNIKDKNGKTPLEIAYEKNNLELATFFKKHGAKDKYEENIKLFETCFKGDLENLKKILANNSKLTTNEVCIQEWKNYFVGWPFYSERPLIWLACARGHGEIVQWLKENGANIYDSEELLSINCRFCRDSHKIIKNKARIDKLIRLAKEKNKKIGEV